MTELEFIETAVTEACWKLYTNHKHLITSCAHERTIVADVIAPSLRGRFPEWTVNTDYNREGLAGDPKRDLRKKLLIPDIIIHRPGISGTPDNYAAFQVKGYWNKEHRRKDSNSLRRIRAKHGYRFLFRIELGEEGHELIVVN
jgi:hypothetical protein